jgi:hypothetical protein
MLLADEGMPDGRRELRLYGPFPAKVRGVDACGESFKADAEVEVISIREVYLRLGREVAVGSQLLIVTRFSKAWSGGVGAPTIALRGTASRVVPGPGKENCVIVLIKRTRFL